MLGPRLDYFVRSTSIRDILFLSSFSRAFWAKGFKAFQS